MRRLILLTTLTAAIAAAVPATAAAVNGVVTNPNTLTFGGTTVGTPSAPQTTTLQHTCTASGIGGTCDVTQQDFFPYITVTGDFTQTNNCPADLATPNFMDVASCTIMVTFTPTTTGARSGTLSTGASGTDPTVALNGTGEAAPVTTPTTPAPTVSASPSTTRKKCKKRRHKAAAAKCKKKR